MDKYAIIIVTYNRKLLLEKCVASALNQTVPADKIVIVNNASTDGTAEYLETDIFYSERFEVVHCNRNSGGAGGFYTGMKRALNYDIDWMIIIDDDAILNTDYAEKLLRKIKTQNQYHAAAGVVKTNGNIDKLHRRRLSKYGMCLKPMEDVYYQKETFDCDIASFCGMMVSKSLVKRIGLPHAYYFIFHDDTEYSLRISNYSKFLIVTDAVVDHRTIINKEKNPRRYTWKDYYEIRNRLFYVREHGNKFDLVANRIDIFIRKTFRNWIFGILRADGYDWKYEKNITRKAIRDAFEGNKE